MRDLNDLQFFVVVVGQRSISAAARLLGVPKSRVSRRITLLEERLGIRLLERSTRSLNVTEAGQQVYEHARALSTRSGIRPAGARAAELGHAGRNRRSGFHSRRGMLPAVRAR